ncbi:unnamed protein product [marine sediment metagenome]|uniref:Uncharacterized protein n=1 Tax=marine sediment metagenome TaxID=412755 RepID=X1FC98_9ZZZZ
MGSTRVVEGSTRVVRCRICGRWLTNPVSVERGIGPVCWARHKAIYGEAEG